MKKDTYNKGITLITLIVTIIVLIILATITIANLLGENGLLNKSRKAADTHKYAQAKEEIELAVDTAILVSERQRKEKTFKQALQEEFMQEPLATNNTSNIEEATTEVIGINREVYEYKIDLETGEITDLKVGETTQGKEIKVNVAFENSTYDWEGISPNLPISIYKYADIDDSGKVKVCEEFKELNSSLQQETILDVSNTLRLDEAEAIQLGMDALTVIKQKSIQPIVTVRAKGGEKNVMLTTNKIDQSVWFVVVGDKDSNEWPRAIVSNIGDKAYQSDACLPICIAKNGKVRTIPDKFVSYNLETLTLDMNILLEEVTNYGDLEITSKVNNYNASEGPNTFVYEIKAVLNGTEEVFSDVISAKIEGSQTKTVVKGIPRGKDITVTIKELYSGVIYDCVGSTTQSYNQQGASNSITFTHDYNQKTGIVTASECYVFKFDEDEGWNFEKVITQSVSNTKCKIETDFYAWTLHTAISNDKSDSERKNYVRVKFFIAGDEISINDGTGKWNEQDGYYCYSEVLNSSAESSEVTDGIEARINKSIEDLEDKSGEKFHVVVVAEMIDALYDEEGIPYMQWP